MFSCLLGAPKATSQQKCGHISASCAWYAHEAFLSVLQRYAFPHFPNAYGDIYILYFCFSAWPERPFCIVCRSLEAEENPWMEHQDTSQSTQLEHLWGLENKASEVWDENKSVIKCYCWEGRLSQVFKNFPYLPCLLTASQITHMVRQTYCCTKHQVEKIKVTACCKLLLAWQVSYWHLACRHPGLHTHTPRPSF